MANFFRSSATNKRGGYSSFADGHANREFLNLKPNYCHHHGSLADYELCLVCTCARIIPVSDYVVSGAWGGGGRG